ncbi:MAG TPA: glycosyltransferase family 4 protein [Thermoanaerobaculia bacterium]|nr:glycosyltransferase family 4 protein [Thermoanaerobaculia bacterium]
MRIFQVLEFNQFNTGSVHQMFQAASGLHDRGHDVTIISRGGSELQERAAAAGVRFRALRMRHQFDLSSMFAMRRVIAELRPEVIHVHKGVAHAIALAATVHAPVGAFVVNRGVSFPLDVWNRGKYRTKRVDRVVTVCRQIKDVIVSSGKLPPDKVEVVYAGTDVAVFDPDKNDRRTFRREKALPAEHFLIGQVGVRDWKGWQELVDSVADVAPRHSHVHLVLIGCRDDREKSMVRDYASTRGISSNVTPVEYRSDMPNVLAACDLVVDASWAGTGITGTIREAMAMRKPVIATNAGGNSELVSSPDVGWLIPMRDHAALTNAILEVIENRSRAIAVARSARTHVVNGFSKDLRISRLENLYSGILDGKGLGGQ